MVLQAEIPMEVYSRLAERARATGRGEAEIVSEALASYFRDSGGPVYIPLSPEQRWLRKHEQEYRGQWVALDGERLLANGKDGRAVAQAARDAGVQSPFLAFVEDQPAPWAGW